MKSWPLFINCCLECIGELKLLQPVLQGKRIRSFIYREEDFLTLPRNLYNKQKHEGLRKHTCRMDKVIMDCDLVKSVHFVEYKEVNGDFSEIPESLERLRSRASCVLGFSRFKPKEQVFKGGEMRVDHFNDWRNSNLWSNRRSTRKQKMGKGNGVCVFAKSARYGHPLSPISFGQGFGTI